ncbi:DUF1501 domain-containing protein [Isosphaera pallida]|uniref:DUF1501 domain-containing protein n=1 Tax=Isosphaera pallida TaxID=128 RepID=UPI0005C6055A
MAGPYLQRKARSTPSAGPSPVAADSRFAEIEYNLNFVNVIGWDTQKQISENSYSRPHQIRDQNLDQALSALMDHLKQRGPLDRAVIVVATKFGRPIEFDSRLSRYTSRGPRHPPTATSTPANTPPSSPITDTPSSTPKIPEIREFDLVFWRSCSRLSRPSANRLPVLPKIGKAI